MNIIRYVELMEVGFLLLISIQLWILIHIIRRSRSPKNEYGAAPAHTVNVNIDRALQAESSSESVKISGAEDERAEVGDAAEDPEEGTGQQAAERPDDAPSEEAVARREERLRLTEELRKQNEEKAKQHERSSMASDKPSSGPGVIKCPGCGVENTAMRRNCFNCGREL